MASALDGLTILDLTEGRRGSGNDVALRPRRRVIRWSMRRYRAAARRLYSLDPRKECVDWTSHGSRPPQQGSRPPLPLSRRHWRIPLRLCATDPQASDVLSGFFAILRSPESVHADWLSALNSRLIHCSITAYGKHGPLKDEPPIDDLIWPEPAF